jgi:hypothetical protein
MKAKMWSIVNLIAGTGLIVLSTIHSQETIGELQSSFLNFLRFIPLDIRSNEFFSLAMASCIIRGFQIFFLVKMIEIQVKDIFSISTKTET